MIFDVMLPGVSDGTVMHHTSVAPAKPIKPYNLKVPGATLSSETYQPCQLCILDIAIYLGNEIHRLKYNKIFLYSLYFLCFSSMCLTNRFAKLGCFSAKYNNRRKTRLPVVGNILSLLCH